MSSTNFSVAVIPDMYNPRKWRYRLEIVQAVVISASTYSCPGVARQAGLSCIRNVLKISEEMVDGT